MHGAHFPWGPDIGTSLLPPLFNAFTIFKSIDKCARCQPQHDETSSIQRAAEYFFHVVLFPWSDIARFRNSVVWLVDSVSDPTGKDRILLYI